MFVAFRPNFASGDLGKPEMGDLSAKQVQGHFLSLLNFERGGRSDLKLCDESGSTHRLSEFYGLDLCPHFRLQFRW